MAEIARLETGIAVHKLAGQFYVVGFKGPDIEPGPRNQRRGCIERLSPPSAQVDVHELPQHLR